MKCPTHLFPSAVVTALLLAVAASATETLNIPEDAIDRALDLRRLHLHVQYETQSSTVYSVSDVEILEQEGETVHFTYVPLPLRSVDPSNRPAPETYEGTLFEYDDEEFIKRWQEPVQVDVALAPRVVATRREMRGRFWLTALTDGPGNESERVQLNLTDSGEWREIQRGPAPVAASLTVPFIPNTHAMTIARLSQIESASIETMDSEGGATRWAVRPNEGRFQEVRARHTHIPASIAEVRLGDEEQPTTIFRYDGCIELGGFCLPESVDRHDFEPNGRPDGTTLVRDVRIAEITSEEFNALLAEFGFER